MRPFKKKMTIHIYKAKASDMPILTPLIFPDVIDITLACHIPPKICANQYHQIKTAKCMANGRRKWTVNSAKRNILITFKQLWVIVSNAIDRVIAIIGIY